MASKFSSRLRFHFFQIWRITFAQEEAEAIAQVRRTRPIRLPELGEETRLGLTTGGNGATLERRGGGANFSGAAFPRPSKSNRAYPVHGLPQAGRRGQLEMPGLSWGDRHRPGGKKRVTRCLSPLARLQPGMQPLPLRA